MFERIFKNPISSVCGLVVGAVQYVADSGTSFTWRGLWASVPTILMGLLFTDGKKSQ